VDRRIGHFDEDVQGILGPSDTSERVLGVGALFSPIGHGTVVVAKVEFEEGHAAELRSIGVDDLMALETRDRGAGIALAGAGPGAATGRLRSARRLRSAFTADAGSASLAPDRLCTAHPLRATLTADGASAAFALAPATRLANQLAFGNPRHGDARLANLTGLDGAEAVALFVARCHACGLTMALLGAADIGPAHAIDTV
jgi:hypothetical protein